MNVVIKSTGKAKARKHQGLSLSGQCDIPFHLIQITDNLIISLVLTFSAEVNEYGVNFVNVESKYAQK